MGLFGPSESDFYSSKDYKKSGGGADYEKYREYDPYAAYSAYSSPLADQYGGVTSQLLSGKLSPAMQEQLNNQFMQNLAQTREGSYGMPIGAQKGLEMQGATQNALQGALLGEQNIQTGLNAAMPFMSFSAAENRAAYDTGSAEHRAAYDYGYNENRYGQSYNQNERQFMAGLDKEAKNKAAESGLNLGSLLQGGVSALTSGILGGSIFGGAPKTQPGSQGGSKFNLGMDYTMPEIGDMDFMSSGRDLLRSRIK